MGEGPLTKEQLDAENREWRERCAALGYPVEVKSPTGVKVHNNTALIKAIMAGIAPHIIALEKQITALQTRVEELERSQKTYLGVWKGGREYTPQSEVTHDGARWIAHKRTSDKPGASADWSLMEKSEPTENRTGTPPAHPRNGGDGVPARPRAS
jgi:hypothetical protein